MSQGLNTLPRSLTIGSLVETSSSFYAPQAFRLQESTDIDSTTGGNYASLETAGVVFVQADGLHYRAYNPSSNSFDGSIVFGQHAYQYVVTADFNNDGYDDLITANLTASTVGQPNSTYITALRSAGATANGALPFVTDNELVSYIDVGAMQLSIEGADIQVCDIAVADFNRDGFLDVILVAQNIYSTNQTDGDQSVNSICYAIGFGNGGGVFTFANGWQPTDNNFGGAAFEKNDYLITPRVTTGDFDGDGYVDVGMAMHGNNGRSGSALPPAFIIWGDANAAATGLLNTASSNKFDNGWLQPQDVQGVRGQAGDATDQFVITFDSSAHIARFNADRTLQQDNEITGLGRGNLGRLIDYDLDGLTDIVSVDGSSSTVLLGYDWEGTTGNVIPAPGFLFGTDILGVAGFDYDGDGKPDLASGYNTDDHLYIYHNQTPGNPDVAQLNLVDRQRVEGGDINGVSMSFMTGTGSQSATVTLLGGNTLRDNALGYYIMGPDGRMGEARFLDLNALNGQVLNIQLLGEGARLGLFLVAEGQARNESLSGTFHFRERANGAEARLGSDAPILVRDGDGRVVTGDIFHALDPSRIDFENPLNSGGHLQALSRLENAGSLVIGFEDTRLPFGDGDFNDLMLRVTHTDMVF
ncbi:VCBS repeat-containing protein [Roseococcus sp. SDR]|uniref:FG-GAP repeat domain-containing protein n=1 Tax=Roseococcus sp. SDR TaxID=2835532 RepID=UPI001BCC0CD2|nr:VCBS repeat-containing protein [Roseococcus sp. SDR]MBS7789791.1 VCBS repeat-containing protein [Roseococcus sp. SDR]MBV1845105.1 VCBS repeat-containing protein [Roseococcus sp. SDR]